MGDEHIPTGLGWPATPPARATPPAGAAQPAEPAQPAQPAQQTPAQPAPRATPAAAGGHRRPGSGGLSPAGLLIALLLGLLGFALVIQLRNVSTDATLTTTRQEDLVRILSDLEAREQRLRLDIDQLEESQRRLNSGVQGRQAALEEATRRADALGILAGSLPARGPGLVVRFGGSVERIKARAVLDAVQELRGAGAEAMQIAGTTGGPVRVVASTYFLDTRGGITVDGRLLAGPYTITVIGDPETMRTALNIPGGVVESVEEDGGTVTMDETPGLTVTARRAPSAPQYARPVS